MIVWTPNADGEYNEMSTEVNGHLLTIFSDRDGEDWGYWIDNDFTNATYGCKTKEQAQKEAIENEITQQPKEENWDAQWPIKEAMEE